MAGKKTNLFPETEDQKVLEVAVSIAKAMFGGDLDKRVRRNQVTVHNTTDPRDRVIQRLGLSPQPPAIVFTFKGVEDEPRLAAKRAIRFVTYCRVQLRELSPKSSILANLPWPQEDRDRLLQQTKEHSVKLLPTIPPGDDSNPARPLPNQYPVWVPNDVVHTLMRVIVADKGVGLRKAMCTMEFENDIPPPIRGFRSAKS
jgi:hypothetical protein